MVKSYQQIFEAHIIDQTTKQPVEEVETADKTYAIVKKEMTFSIFIESKYPKKFFATKLFVDGNEVSSFRIFKAKQTYLGFNVGQGEFRQFKFSLPNYTFEFKEQTTTQQQKQGLIGTIRIEIFDTIEYEIKGKIQKKLPQARTKQQYEDPCLYLEKKNIQKTLAVRMGGAVQAGPSEEAFQKMQKARYNPITHKSIQYKADPRRQIDEILLKYADFGQLLFANLISLYNENHLKYIPTSLLSNNAYLLSEIIKGFLMKATKKSLSFVEIEEKFCKLTGKNINEMIKEGIPIVNGKGLWVRKDRVGLIEKESVMKETVKQLSNYSGMSKKKGECIKID